MRKARLTLLTVAVLAGMASFVSGTTVAAEEPDDIVPARTAGDRLWVSRHTGNGDRAVDRPTAIYTDPTGRRVFVTGISDPGALLTVAYDGLTGDEIWAVRHRGNAVGNPDITVDPTGTVVVVAGEVARDESGHDRLVIAYDAEDGSELWSQHYDGPDSNNDHVCLVTHYKCLAVTEQAVFITGTANLGTNRDIVTIAYSLHDGEELWTAVFDGGHGSDSGNAIAASQDGNRVVVVGSTTGPDSSSDWVAIVYSADGEQLWTASHDGPAHDYDQALSVAIDQDDTRIFVTGFVSNEDSRFPGDPIAHDYHTIAYSLDTGEELWSATYDGGVEDPDFGRDEAREIAVKPDGTVVYVTGNSEGNERLEPCCGVTADWDATTIAYDAATGEELWVQRHDGPGNANDIGYAIAATDRRVFVGGDSLTVPSVPPIPASARMFLTVAYDAATGEELWVRHYGPSQFSDSVFDLALASDPLGARVYVTGESYNHETVYDYATVAYLDVLPELMPVASVDDTRVEISSETSRSVIHEFRLSNPGGSELQWRLFQDPPVGTADVRSIRTSEPNRSATRQLSYDPMGGDGVATESTFHQSEAILQSGALTQSTSLEVMADNSVACVSDLGGTYGAGYLRVFELYDFDIATGFEVTEVSFGIEAIRDSGQEITLNLYTLHSDELTEANLRLVGQTKTFLEPQELNVVTVPVNASVPSGSRLVVEVESPRTVGFSWFFMGSNDLGQSAPSYIRSAPCGNLEPVDLADVGAPHMHIVMAVTGTSLPACDIGFVDWASTRTRGGTMKPGDEVVIEVEFTATEEGRKEGTLCLQTNDPSNGFVRIPVEFSAQAPAEPVDPEDPSDDPSTGGDDPVEPEPSFDDVPGDHTFGKEITWLAAAGITRGCNPPTNDRFCPDERVTRGQMAAFLKRALGLSAAQRTFVDTDGHLFERDIAALAAADITRGCNPPTNDRFCPDERVTRGQMAAFLKRALGLSAAQRTFVDTDGHLFERDIAALAAADITRGCNPPTNDRFCPDQPVTRGEMAAFLYRGLTD